MFYTQQLNLTPGAHVLPRLLAHVLATPELNQEPFIIRYGASGNPTPPYQKIVRLYIVYYSSLLLR